MLTEKELASMRNMSLAILVNRCTITRKTSEADDFGGTDEWTAIATNVPCRVAEQGEGRAGTEGAVGGRLSSTGDHTVRLPFGTDIDESDRIIVNVSGIERTFEVSRVIENSFATNTTVVCSEVR